MRSQPGNGARRSAKASRTRCSSLEYVSSSLARSLCFRTACSELSTLVGGNTLRTAHRTLLRYHNTFKPVQSCGLDLRLQDEHPSLRRPTLFHLRPTATFQPNTPLETGEPIVGQGQNQSIFQLMGQLSPYFPNPSGFGVAEYPLPPGAEITHVQVSKSYRGESWILIMRRCCQDMALDIQPLELMSMISGRR
jgi:hypothetical protein